MVVNSRNLIGWLRLALDVLELPEWQVKKIRDYINRTDTIRRQKELNDIFGGDELWLI